METEPNSVEDILVTLCVFYDCSIKSIQHGFAILPASCSWVEDLYSINILLHPLLEERRQIYAQDAAKIAGGNFGGEVNDTLARHKLRESISALVEQQIEERR